MKRLLARDVPAGAAVTIVALVLVASVVTGRDPGAEPVVEPVAARLPAVEPARRDAKTDADDLDIARLKRTKREGESSDLFAPPPQPVVVAARPAAVAPPPPSAPPLPYRYVGRMVDGDVLTLFVSNGADTLAAHVGDTLDGTWRIDSVSETSVSFRYLPLDLVRPLALPAP